MAETSSGEPAPAADPGERRFVTVLFTDLVGFTTFSEGRDPEDVRSLLTRYFERARTIVERFGGEVDKFIGDAVMAVWGAGAAREDDPERAVRAALELMDSVTALGEEIGAPDLAARAGVTSGETSVGSGGNEKGLVVGDLVNVASRLQTMAPPGSVLVGGATADLARASIEFQHAGIRDVKGKSDPVEAWIAIRVVAGRQGSGRGDGLIAPFCGREHELRMMKDILEATGDQQRVRLVSIVGEGGIGKSRLIEELAHHVDGLAEDVYWHQGRSPSYGDGLAFWALGEMVRRRCGIAETDDDHRTTMRLRTALAEFVPEAADRAWIEPRLAGLLGIGQTPEGDKSELFAAWRTFFEHVARRGTTVMVFEDLHWADAGMIEFVDEFTSRAPAVPVLIITLARPELLERHPGWGSGKANTMAMHLAPLSDEHIADVVSGMAPGVGTRLTTKVVERAGGIPLYAVEMVRMLVNQGVLSPVANGFEVTTDVDDLEVPDSLHGLVGARIDQLGRDDRDLLQDAAVLGQSFVAAGLAAMTGSSETSLIERLDWFVEKSLLTVDRDPRSPERGQYQFVQSLIREVAYGRLTRSERKRRHLSAAHYFERLDEPELAGAVVSHYLSAIAAEPDADDAPQLKAALFEALIAAADRAASLHSHPQVIALCQQGVAITDDDRQRGELWLRAAMSGHAMLAADSTAFGRRAIAAFEGHGTPDERLRSARVLATIFNDQYLTTDSLQVLGPIVEMYSDETSSEAARAKAELARTYMFTGRASEALPLLDDALTIGERLDLVDLVADALVTRGTGLAEIGRAREGLALLRAGTELAETHELTKPLRRGLNNLGYIAQSDSLVEMLVYARKRLDMARRIGEPRDLFDAQVEAALSAAYMAEWEVSDATVADIQTEGLPRADQLRVADIERASRMWRGDADWAESRYREILAESEQELGSIQDPRMQANVEIELSTLALAGGRFTEAYERAIAMNDERPGSLDLTCAAWAAIALEDATRLSAVRDRLQARPFRGRLVDSQKLIVEAGLTAIAGDTARAAALFEEADRLQSEVGSPIDRAFTAAIASKMLGTEGVTLAETANGLCDRFELKSITALFPHIDRASRRTAKSSA